MRHAPVGRRELEAGVRHDPLHPSEQAQLLEGEIGEEVAQAQSKKLNALRSRRSNEEVRRRLDALKHAAAQEPKAGDNGQISPVNTMPFIVDAVRAYATLGEICDAMRSVFGSYQ